MSVSGSSESAMSRSTMVSSMKPASHSLIFVVWCYDYEPSDCSEEGVCNDLVIWA